MTTTDKATIWFARSNPYGNRTISDSDALVAFQTREDRDAWVTADEHHEPRREALGPEDARSIYAHGGAECAAIIDPRQGFVPPEQRQFADPDFDRILNGPYTIGAN